MDDIQRIVGEIKNANNIAMACHIMPDGDSLGSLLALSRALCLLNIKNTMYIDYNIPDKFGFLYGINEIKPYSANNKSDYDIFIALDCGDKERLGRCQSLIESSDCTINIDHHASNTMFGDYNYVDKHAAATGEIIFNILTHLDIDIDTNIAECLYTAIATDTGNFSYSNTTSDTHIIAGKLLEYDIDVDYITLQLFRKKNKKDIVLLKKVLDTLEYYSDDKIASIELKKDMITGQDYDSCETQGIIGMVRDIEGVEIAVFFKQVNENEIKVGLRSKNKYNVKDIAVQFNGGGHDKAAGFTLDTDLYTCKRMVIKKLIETINED
ncbi:MAG: bifunctional oligoribonuclease/PAP phosphatase NrnA [Clostridia bacterium]|nr:bifunctional oligoribonuclease/PAP phosphatase NrnA [Clostridia bacterium]